jgi:4-hydroxythreonine-4-phosphate dehydrogenase
VTAPISKEAWSLAGFKWPGHTELLAHRAKAKQVSMVFDSPQLKVSLVTVHVPLMAVRDMLTIGRVFDAISRGQEACQLLGIARPRIAVCGLNPHAGEGGVLGWEEEKVIRPAIAMALNNGVDVHGPFPADTLFRRAVDGEFDLVVAMYHDQGLIPTETARPRRSGQLERRTAIHSHKSRPRHGL